LQLREAQPRKEDALGIYDLLVDMHSNTGLALPKINTNKVLRRIGYTVEQGKIFLAQRGEHLIGALGVVRDEPWWSSEQHLADTFFYVKPDARAGGTAVKLLGRAKKYAGELGLPLFINLLTGKDLFRKERFLARMGFERVGSLHVQSVRLQRG
jgi:GNAT superfamily N-acetyltransferase